MGVSFSTDDGVSFSNYADFYTDIDQFTAVGISPNGKGMWLGALNYSEHYGGMWHRGALPVMRGFTSVGQADSVHQTPLVIYPNPATDVVTIESQEPIKTVELISMQGIVVKSVVADSHRCTMTLIGLQEGIYIVRTILSNGSVQFGRMVKR